MNIKEIEDNLNTYSSDPERVLGMIMNILIRNQASVEAILNTQAMILAELRKDMTFQEIHADMEKDINYRVNILQAESASRI